MEFITFYSTAGCGADCGSVTGTNLFNSQQVVTVDIANQGGSAGAIFYAYWSELKIDNSGAIGAVIGQTIWLNNTGNISFADTVTTGNLAYVVKYYQILSQ
jgi:hypothetical protein